MEPIIDIVQTQEFPSVIFLIRKVFSFKSNFSAKKKTVPHFSDLGRSRTVDSILTETSVTVLVIFIKKLDLDRFKHRFLHVWNLVREVSMPTSHIIAETVHTVSGHIIAETDPWLNSCGKSTISAGWASQSMNI